MHIVGGESYMLNRVAQVNLLTFFGLLLLLAPSKSRPQNRESVSLVIKEGKTQGLGEARVWACDRVLGDVMK